MKKEKSAPSGSPRVITESDLKNLPWRSVGPAIMGGRVTDLCFKPGDTRTFYVGYATGGLWVTKNRGTTFSPIFDHEVTCSIGSVVCCGKDGKTLWVGTGEGNGRNSSSWGHGVYRSDDAGENWTHLGLEQTHDIPRLVVHPKDINTCFVAALGHLWGFNEERGVYRTTDGGKTWEKILYIDDRTGCCDVVLDPDDPNVIYAAMYMRHRTPYSFVSGGPKGGIYKSVDGGSTWKKLGGGLPNQTGRIGLDIVGGKQKTLLAVVESTELGGNSIRDDRMRGGGVFKSLDGGETWERLSVRSPRAFYFSKVKMDPRDLNRVYMLGWTTEISDDGGKTFREGRTNLLHADHHAILVSPDDSDHLIIGTDGGVYQSFDRGENWDFLNTMATGQFYNISLDNSEPYRIMGGLQDNGTWIGPSANHFEEPEDKAAGIPATALTNRDWDGVFWGDGFHSAFDPQDSEIVYAEWQGGNLTRINLRTGEKKFISPEQREGGPKHRFNWNAPFFVSAHEPSTLYHAGNYVFKLTQRGEKWERISDDLTTRDPVKMETVGSHAESHCTVVALAESPLKPGVLWAGSDDGLIHLTKDDGKTWKNVTPKEINGRYVSRIIASAHVAGRAYASIDGHRNDDMDPCILVTEDFGEKWSEITSDLPLGFSVKSIQECADNAEFLVAGTEMGVYFSFNRGKQWIKSHGKSLPTVPVDDIKFHPRDKDIVLGTHGRSIYVLDCAHPLSEINSEIIQRKIHLFTVKAARPRWTRHYNGNWTHKLFRAANSPAGVVVWYWVNEYLGEDVKIEFKDKNGVVQKTMSSSGSPGLHRAVWNLVPEEWLQCADEGEEPMMPFHVRPGTYKVTLALGKEKAEGEFEVLPRR